MKNVVAYWLSLALFAVLVTGCEKSLLEEEGVVPSDANVVLKLSIYDDLPFDTRSKKPVSQLCSRLNVAFFQNGAKVKTVAQKSEDSGFGTVAVTLEEGSYEVVVIAHNSDGSATITSTEKVTFPNNLVTDTFYYYGTLTVEASQKTYDLDIKRVVAMFRLMLPAPLPAAAKRIRFYYTGGSSTFSPLAGYGCVNSRQTVWMDLGEGQQTFEIYTLPHEETDVLKILISVYDSKDDVLKELTLDNVRVTRNRITQYAGELIEGGTMGGSSFNIYGESDWDGADSYTF